MSERPRRAVVLVGNPANPYSRALRIARSLAGEGFEVEIAAIAAAGVPDREQDDVITIRRYPSTGPFARFAATHGATSSRPAGEERRPAPSGRRRLRVPGRVRSLVRRAGTLARWVIWPHTVRGWWASLGHDLAPADLYHACGSLTIAPALAAARRSRRAGHRPVVIYDAIDNVFEGNNVRGMPALLRRVHAARERRWARRADAVITVNDALATRLSARWGMPAPLSIPNYPEPWTEPADGRPDRIRTALGLPAATRIVLFQGRLSPNLGLDEAAEAVLGVDDACLVLLGFGRWLERCRERDRDPRFAGRHFTLPAVHPDELPAWTASADVALVTLPPVSTNQRESTPNKFWESLLVGTPVVLGPGLAVMAEIVTSSRAGVVARSMEPAAIADAIREILDGDPETRAEDRRRIASLAASRYVWPVAAARYTAVVGELTAR